MSKIIRSAERVKTARLSQICPERKPGSKTSDSSGRTSKELSPEELAKKAEAEGQRLLASAKDKSKEIEENAHKQGYQAGLETAREEIHNRLETLRRLVLNALEEKKRIIEAAETELIGLSTKIAEKIINQEVTTNPKVVAGIAKRAIELVVDREQVIIRVNPIDREMIRSYKEELLNSADGISNIQVVADQRVERGGCVIETNSGNVDAQLTSQLTQIKGSLQGAIGGDRQKPN